MPKTRSRRINSAEEAGFPMEQLIDVEAIRLHRDGTLDVVMREEDMPASLVQPLEASNRRNTRRKRSRR